MDESDARRLKALKDESARKWRSNAPAGLLMWPLSCPGSLPG